MSFLMNTGCGHGLWSRQHYSPETDLISLCIQTSKKHAETEVHTYIHYILNFSPFITQFNHQEDKSSD